MDEFVKLAGRGAALLTPFLMGALALVVVSCGSSTPTAELASEHDFGNEEAILTKLAPDETFDQIRAGTRLVMSYDPATNSFTGTVQNTTSYRLLNVRVEVHLEGGPELGPAPPIDLAPGDVQPVELQSTVPSFTGWVAWVEVGSQGW